jgi:hypothetical protein
MTARKSTAFESIKRGLEDAIAYAKGDVTKGRIVAGRDVEDKRVKAKRP